MVRLDVDTSPSEISVIPIQGRVSADSGTGCVPRPLVGLTHRLTPSLTHSLPDFPYEKTDRHPLLDPCRASGKYWGKLEF